MSPKTKGPIVFQRIVFGLMSLAALAATVPLTVVGADAASRRARPPTQVATTAPQQTAETQAISVVNDQIISEYDLNQRVALFFVTSGLRPSPETLPMIREQVLRTLQDEILQVKEAVDHGVTVTRGEVDAALEGIAQDNRSTVAQIEETLARSGVAMGTFRAQLTAQIAWNKAVQGRFGQRLDIRDEEVTAAIERIKQGASKPQFRVSEIYLAIDKPEDDAKVRAAATQLLNQINAGAPFATVARQFSQSPSAALGGDVGWVQDGQLADELNQALKALRRGGIAGPLRVAGGYYLLQLRARREPAGTVVAPVVAAGPPTGPVPLARMLLPMQGNAPAAIRDRAFAFAVSVAQNAQSCAHLQAIAKSSRAFFMSLGVISPKNLSPQVQAALAKTEPGGIAPPFFSSDGIEIIARCEPRPEPIETILIPTPEQMKNQLFSQKASILARSYLRDLRRDAVIESR